MHGVAPSSSVCAQAASRREPTSELGQKAMILLTEVTTPQLRLSKVQVPDIRLSFGQI